MKREEAERIYLRRTRIAGRIIGRLEKWDTGILIKENAINLGITLEAARSLASRYGLKYKAVKTSGPYPSDKCKAYQILEKNGYSLQRIGDLFGVTRQAIYDALSRMNMREPSKS